MDWDAVNRLHEKGYIGNPKSKAKSVVLTEEGVKSYQIFLPQAKNILSFLR